MLTNPSPQPLLAQFQARYPTASLIADLLTIHHDHYVVRAVVQMGNTLLATGMATATDIEQAENRAKVRAMEALGIETFNSASLQPVLSSYSPLPFTSVLEQTDLPETSPVPAAATPPASPPLRGNAKATKQPPPIAPLPSEYETALSSTSEQFESSLPELKLPSPSQSDPPSSSDPPSLLTEAIDSTSNATLENEFTYSPDSLTYPLPEEGTLTAAPLPFDAPLPLDTALEIPSPSVEPSPPAVKGKAAKRKSEPASTPSTSPPAASSSENDRSEEIAKIGVEMKRLGWTTDQGKNYLKRTYGKRSRQELSDDELIDFLRYLENQPPPTESLF